MRISRFRRALYHAFRKAEVRRKKSEFTPAGWLLFIAVCAAGLMGLDTTRTLLYQVFTFLLALLLLTFAWRFRFRPRLSVKRELPKFGTAGDRLEYRLLISNLAAARQVGLFAQEIGDDPCPTLEEFVNTPEPGEERRNPYDRLLMFYRWKWLVYRKKQADFAEWPAPPLPRRAETDMRVAVTPLRRGYLRLTGLRVIRCDPFNLCKAFCDFPCEDRVLILPKRYALPPFALPGARKFKRGGVALASSVGESEEFVALRDYRPGDPLRHIHWKSWAKVGKPIVKEYQDEYFVRHALVLDTFQQAAYTDVFEEAVSLAASFACVVRTQDSLLDLMFVGPEAYCFTAGRSLSHTEQMLEILASVTVCSDKPFSALPPMIFERAEMLSGCICILLAWDAERRKFIETLRGFGLPLLVFVVTGAENRQAVEREAAQNTPPHFLEVGQIQEGLNLLNVR